MSIFIALKVIHRLNVYRVSVTITGLLAVIVSLLAGCAQPYISTVKVSAPTSEEIEALSEEIKQSVKELEYSDTVAEDFAEWVLGWEDNRGLPALAVWKKQLLQVRNEHAGGKINENELARFEESASQELCQRILKQFANGDFYDLADVIEHKKAQCVGKSQLVYILANSVGVSTHPIIVQELSSGVLPIGAGHVACIVNFSNNTTVMVDLSWPVRKARPFTFEEEFEKRGEYWELKDEDNALRIHRRIQILDTKGLAACVYGNRAYDSEGLDRHTQAISEYNKAIELNSHFAEAYCNRGSCFSALGQYDKALFDYDKAIELNPNYATAYSNRGNVFSDLGQYSKATHDYTRAITLNPEFIEAYVNRASSNISLREYEKSIADCNKALELNPKYGEAYINRAIPYARLGNIKQAEDDLRYAVAWKPALIERVKKVRDSYGLTLSDDAISQASKGFMTVKFNRKGKAEVDFVGDFEIPVITPEGKILSGGPSIPNVSGLSDRDTSYGRRTIVQDTYSVTGYVERGNSYFNLQQYNEAISEYNKAIELNSQFAEAYINRAGAYFSLQQYEKAISDCNKAIELNPQLAEAYFNRVVPYAKLGKLQEAVNDLTKAIVLNPSLRQRAKKVFNDYLARPMGLSIKMTMGKGGATRVVELRTKTGTLTPELKALLSDGYAEKRSARDDSGRSVRSPSPSSKDKKLSTNDVAGHVKRANTYYRSRQYSKAISEYSKAIELDPGYAAAYYNRGNAYASLKKYEQAKKDLLKAVELDPALKPNIRKSSDTYKLNLSLD